MLKTMVGAAAAALALMAAPAAFAQDWYVRGELGGTIDGKVDVQGIGGGFDVEDGLLVAGAIGADLGSGLRVEGELLNVNPDVKIPGSSSDVEVTALMANVAYDFAVDWPVKPYVGAGIGWARTEHTNPLTRDDDTNFAWQLKAGAALELSPGWALDANYRYLNAPDFEGRRTGGGATVKADTDAHVLSVGFRYKFGM